MILVMHFNKTSKHSLRRKVGIGSRSQCFVGLFLIMVPTSSSVTGSKLTNASPLNSLKVGSSIHALSKTFLIDVILLSKKLKTSDHDDTLGITAKHIYVYILRTQGIHN